MRLTATEMQMEKSITAEQIRNKYFTRSGMVVPLNSPLLSGNLTASAKFVLQETKKLIGTGSAKPEDEPKLLELIRDVEEIHGEQLTDKERTCALAALQASFEHYDLLSPLVCNVAVNDIIVRSFDDISIQIGRKNIQTDLKFADHPGYLSFVENLLKRTGKTCTLATPVVDAALDRHVRACVTHESFSPAGSGPMLTLRIARHGQINLERLAINGLAPPVILNYLAAIVRSGCASILIAGEVGTGKTTLVRALAAEVQAEHSILVIEDTNEIVLHRPFVRTLLTREANSEGAGRISPALAIRTGMRMAMNRIILGEMRDAETAEAFIDVCASGHPGMSTIHARSARDAIARLELFLLRAQGNVEVETARRQIANAIGVVVYLEVSPDSGLRRIRSVLEIGSASEGAVQVSPMFEFHDFATGGAEPYWERQTGVSSFSRQLIAAGITLPASGTVFPAGRGEPDAEI